MMCGWIEAVATDSLEKKWVLCFYVLNEILFKHSKLTGLYTEQMAMLMKAWLFKTALWLKMVEIT